MTRANQDLLEWMVNLVTKVYKDCRARQDRSVRSEHPVPLDHEAYLVRAAIKATPVLWVSQANRAAKVLEDTRVFPARKAIRENWDCP